MATPRSQKSPRPKGLVLVLSAMPRKQRALFTKYLNFEPFNTHPKLPELFALIEQKILSKSEFSKKIEDLLPGSSINPTQVNKLITLLHQKLDQFLSLQQMEKSPHRSLPFILEAYQELEVEPALAEKKWRQVKKKLDAGEQSTEHLYQQIGLEHFALQSRIQEGPHATGSHFQDIHALADLAYVVTKMKYLCGSFAEASIFNLEPPIEELEKIQPLIHSMRDQFPPLAKAYEMVLDLLTHIDHSAESSQEAIEFLKARQSDINRDDLFDLYNFILNICYRRIDIGEKAFGVQACSIYDYMLDSGLLISKGEINPRNFKNIVSLNSREKRYDWCLNFIQTYQKYLPQKEDTLLPLYCEGLVYFYSGKNAQSANIFRNIMKNDPKDHFWGFESRNLLLKSLFHRYEALPYQELEELHRLIDSFRMSVRRNSKLSKFHKKSYLNFIQNFTIMVRLKEQDSKDSNSLIKLREEIKSLNFITHKDWLLEVLEEKNWLKRP